MNPFKLCFYVSPSLKNVDFLKSVTGKHPVIISHLDYVLLDTRLLLDYNWLSTSSEILLLVQPCAFAKLCTRNKFTWRKYSEKYYYSKQSYHIWFLFRFLKWFPVFPSGTTFCSCTHFRQKWTKSTCRRLSVNSVRIHLLQSSPLPLDFVFDFVI